MANSTFHGMKVSVNGGNPQLLDVIKISSTTGVNLDNTTGEIEIDLNNIGSNTSGSVRVDNATLLDKNIVVAKTASSSNNYVDYYTKYVFDRNAKFYHVRDHSKPVGFALVDDSYEYSLRVLTVDVLANKEYYKTFENTTQEKYEFVKLYRRETTSFIIRRINLTENKVFFDLYNEDGLINSLEVSDRFKTIRYIDGNINGYFIVSDNDNHDELKVYNHDLSQLATITGSGDDTHTVTLTQGSTSFLVSIYNGNIYLYDPSNNFTLKSTTDISSHSDGSLTSDNQVGLYYYDNSIYVVEIGTNKYIKYNVTTDGTLSSTSDTGTGAGKWLTNSQTSIYYTYSINEELHHQEILPATHEWANNSLRAIVRANVHTGLVTTELLNSILPSTPKVLFEKVGPTLNTSNNQLDAYFSSISNRELVLSSQLNSNDGYNIEGTKYYVNQATGNFYAVAVISGQSKPKLITASQTIELDVTGEIRSVKIHDKLIIIEYNWTNTGSMFRVFNEDTGATIFTTASPVVNFDIIPSANDEYLIGHTINDTLSITKYNTDTSQTTSIISRNNVHSDFVLISNDNEEVYYLDSYIGNIGVIQVSGNTGKDLGIDYSITGNVSIMQLHPLHGGRNNNPNLLNIVGFVATDHANTFHRINLDSQYSVSLIDFKHKFDDVICNGSMFHYDDGSPLSVSMREDGTLSVYKLPKVSPGYFNQGIYDHLLQSIKESVYTPPQVTEDAEFEPGKITKSGYITQELYDQLKSESSNKVFQFTTQYNIGPLTPVGIARNGRVVPVKSDYNETISLFGITSESTASGSTDGIALFKPKSGKIFGYSSLVHDDPITSTVIHDGSTAAYSGYDSFSSDNVNTPEKYAKFSPLYNYQNLCLVAVEHRSADLDIAFSRSGNTLTINHNKSSLEGNLSVTAFDTTNNTVVQTLLVDNSVFNSGMTFNMSSDVDFYVFRFTNEDEEILVTKLVDNRETSDSDYNKVNVVFNGVLKVDNNLYQNLIAMIPTLQPGDTLYTTKDKPGLSNKPSNEINQPVGVFTGNEIIVNITRGIASPKGTDVENRAIGGSGDATLAIYR